MRIVSVKNENEYISRENVWKFKTYGWRFVYIMAVSKIKNECRRSMYECSKHMAILCLVSEIYLARERMNVQSVGLRFIWTTVM